MKARLLALFLSLLLGLSACTGGTTASPAPDDDFHRFLTDVNARRRAAVEESTSWDLSPWTGDTSDEPATFTVEEIDRLLTPHDPVSSALTRAQLLEDAETAFALLKSTYGAYDYFGGDAVFLPLRDAVKDALSDAGAPDTALLAELLYNALSPVVQDGHFTVDSRSLMEGHRQTMYYVPDLYVDDPTSLDAAFLKPTVAEDGHIAYGFIALTAHPDSLPERALIGEEEVTLSWKAASPVGQNAKNPYEQTTWEGLPVLQSRAMFGQTAKANAQLARFAASGPDWAVYPAFVFDVRSNPGGSDRYVMDWFAGFAGQAAQPRRAFASRGSLAAARAFSFEQQPGSWSYFCSDGVFVENDSLIFLLQDADTASSGETAVEFLRSTDNVLILGSPTRGCALVPNNLTVYLPNSALPLYFGTGLHFTETMENRDGTGFLPDLWVDPAEAESAVLRLFAYYHLT